MNEFNTNQQLRGYTNLDLLFKQDWFGSRDNLAFSLRSEDICKEDILSFARAGKKTDSSFYVTLTNYHFDVFRPSLWQVIKRWWKYDSSSTKFATRGGFSREQMIALRDWIDEMLYDPEYNEGFVEDVE